MVNRVNCPHLQVRVVRHIRGDVGPGATVEELRFQAYLVGGRVLGVIGRTVGRGRIDGRGQIPASIAEAPVYAGIAVDLVGELIVNDPLGRLRGPGSALIV